ncbi:MAG TPA: hypothetical protein VL523_07400 [Terriglobia bacterium]|nr:hypothetical protein [Terriglobia bacterium]
MVRKLFAALVLMFALGAAPGVAFGRPSSHKPHPAPRHKPHPAGPRLEPHPTGHAHKLSPQNKKAHRHYKFKKIHGHHNAQGH